MTTFIGDQACKVDAKGRLLLPATFKKQITSAVQDKFVVKKDIYEPCLVLYTMEEWKRQNDMIRKNANPFSKKFNQFLRAFYHGSAEVEMDAANRILIPKRLLEEVKIDKEVILSGQDSKIEIWSKDIYDQTIDKGDDFANLAEEVMGGIINDNGE
jgi:MraZ protein